ncbi:hypothetical protein [Rhodopseudomonas sp. B29]|uniref:hypothetical protein n=1 Tax=Rhodopseudomonas sp. B29 TaxID=95607 RepID=UPI00034515F3|nr:hypothetical protein [Rhodopseudomonas sp. B29]
MPLFEVRKTFERVLGRFHFITQIAIVCLALLVFGGILFWIFNEVVYYYVARSYADEIADAYDLNPGFARAVLWGSFAAVTILGGLSFSLSAKKRWIGIGGALALIIAHSLLIARIDANFRKNGVAQKCYVMTRTSIKTLNRAGIDPETGRECRPLTPQIAEKIEEYRRGNRPAPITSAEPTFFDPTTGEPIVWYFKTESGNIELFNLMGFHPQTGEELLPIDRNVAEVWRKQSAQLVRRVPLRLDDPTKFGFFDATTGNARVWFWRDHAGNLEFYDGPGFHPESGDPLRIISRDVITEWQQQQSDKAARKRAEQEERERIQQQAVARKAEEDRQAAERARLEREAEAAELRERQQSGDDCDRLAANPTDAQRSGPGVPFDLLKHQAESAYSACTRAVATFPFELRYQYQLGRAAQFKDRKQAFAIFSRLTQASYPAAFDNLGTMYLYDQKDSSAAVAMFKRGASLDDADSMVSLVDMIDRGLFPVPNPMQAKIALLNRAAQLGHGGAQRAYQAELQKAEQERANQLNQQQMLQLFGAIVQGVARR